jgi:XRE family transcriptional regulator, regulator of sulfur utilization
MDHSKYLKELGEKIRKLRKEKGLSQENIAQECGINRITMTRIESGVANATIKMLLDISAQLGLQIDELLKV